jgi:AsmA-like protein
MKLPRPVIYLGVIATVALVIVAAGALLLPRLIDSRLIKDKISSELLKKTHSSVTFGKIVFLWLPQPRVVIENAELSFADKAQGSIRSVIIYPSLVYLLTGRLVVRRALLQEPKITMRLPERPAKQFDLEGLEKQIRSALVGFASGLLAPRVEVADGAAEITIGDKPRVILSSIAAQTAVSSGELRFGVSARANFSDQIKLAGKIVPDTLAADFNLAVRQLDIHHTVAMLAPESSQYAQQGKTSFDVKIASVGLRQFRAAIDGTLGPLVVARQGGVATVEAKRMKGAIAYQAGDLQVDVESLDLGAPRLQASGQLKLHSGRFSTRIQVRDADIAELNELAMRIADDREFVRTARRYVSSGTIPEVTIQSAGASLAELGSSRNLAVSGALRDGKIFIPGADLDLRNVSGSARFSAGILEADGVSADLGAAKGWSGKLKLGLEGKSGPFHLEISLQAGAAEVHSTLLKFVRDDAFRHELLKVKNVEGELSGRLILGERLDAISPILTIAKADVSLNYAPIPFPVAIRGSRFSYDRSLISLENAQATVGRSHFGRLGVTFRRDGSRKMTVRSEDASIDLRQTVTVLRSFKELTGYFAKIQSARGQVKLQKLALAGAYDYPAGWLIESTGSVSQVELQHADFPDRIYLSRGKITASHGQIAFADTAASMADASFNVDGRFEYKQGKAIRVETNGKGDIGGWMTHWLSRYVGLPEDVKLRSPLTIAAKRLTWRMDGDISFDGHVTVAGGPELVLDVAKQPQGFTMPNLSIFDGGRSARMTARRVKDKVDFSFTGELAEQTFDRLFASFPMQPLSLQGEIQASALMADPISVLARGRLSGSHLSIPLGTEKAMVDQFRLEADGDSVVIRSADFSWGQSRFMMTGRVARAKERLRVDLDVTGERVDWQQIQGAFGRESGRREAIKSATMSIPPVEGMVRLKADRFTHERFNVSSLDASAAITPTEINVDIKQAIACGITAAGRLDFIGKEIGVDLQLAASDAPLEPAALCLTNQQNDVKGTYTMRSRLVGRGEGGVLWRSLNGNFEFSARDGEFIRAPGIDATFDYLNASGDFKVAFPDLNREAFPYRLIGVKGRIEGKMLIADEVTIDSPSVNLSGQGEIDLERKQIAGKGLVAVLKPVDDVLAKIPGLSTVLGGSLVGIPIRVAGPIERPEITYLSPADVGAGLLNIPLRILGIPLGAMRLFTPSATPQGPEIGK